MNKLRKRILGLVTAALLTGPFITVFAQVDEGIEADSVELELPSEESNEENESSMFLEDELIEPEEDKLLLEEEESRQEGEAVPEDETTLSPEPEKPQTIEIKDILQAEDLSLTEESSAGKWLIKLDIDRVKAALSSLEDLDQQEALRLVKESEFVIYQDEQELTRIRMDEAGTAVVGIREPLVEGSRLKVEIPKIESKKFTLTFEALEWLIHDSEKQEEQSQTIIVENALNAWDLEAIETGKKGKWSIGLVTEEIAKALDHLSNGDRQELMKLLSSSQMILSIDGDDSSQTSLTEAGIATFDIRENLPDGTVVTFSLPDIKWDNGSSIGYKVEIAPLTIEVSRSNEILNANQEAASINVDVTSSATEQISLGSKEWLVKSGIFKLTYTDEGDSTKVTGKLNSGLIHDKIRAIPNTTYSEYITNAQNTMREIAKGKIFVRINNGDYVNPEGFNVSSSMQDFEFYIPKITQDDLITFEFGPDLYNLGSISVYDRYWVHFEALTTNRSGTDISNSHLSSDAIIIDSPQSPLGIDTDSINGRIDTDKLKSQLLDLDLLGLDFLDIFESLILTPLLNLLSDQSITLTIMDGEEIIFTNSQQLGLEHEFEFDISSVNLKAGHRLILSIESFFIDISILSPLLNIRINNSFDSKILYVEDIHLESVTSQLDFSDIEFSYKGIQNKPADSGMEIKVTDNRRASDSYWQLSAQASGADLMGASFDFKNGNLTADKDISAYPFSLSDFKLTIGGDSQNFVTVNREATGGNVGIIHWALNYGPSDILLIIPPVVMEGLNVNTSYSAAIKWTLTKGP